MRVAGFRGGNFPSEVRLQPALNKHIFEMKHQETGLQKQVVQWLKLKGFMYTTTGAGLIKSRNTQMIMTASGYYKGCGDLMVFIPNGCLHLELKRPAQYKWSEKTNRMIKVFDGGKQSGSQKEFQEKIEKICGHHYLVADNLDDVIKYIEDNKIKPM